MKFKTTAILSLVFISATLFGILIGSHKTQEATANACNLTYCPSDGWEQHVIFDPDSIKKVENGDIRITMDWRALKFDCRFFGGPSCQGFVHTNNDDMAFSPGASGQNIDWGASKIGFHITLLRGGSSSADTLFRWYWGKSEKVHSTAEPGLFGHGAGKDMEMGIGVEVVHNDVYIIYLDENDLNPSRVLLNNAMPKGEGYDIYCEKDNRPRLICHDSESESITVNGGLPNSLGKGQDNQLSWELVDTTGNDAMFFVNYQRLWLVP